MRNYQCRGKSYLLPSKTFLKLEQFRFSPLVLQSPFSTNIHELSYLQIA